MFAIAAVCLWLIAANMRAMFPSRDRHWRFAYGMMVLGVPLGAWLYVSAGVFALVLFLIAASSTFRWPLIYAWRWLRRRLG